MNADPTGSSPICVIGAGLTGLTAAYELTRAGHRVVVLESALVGGGMLRAFRLGGQDLEYIYHHSFTSDSYLLDLCHKLGLSDQMRWQKTKDAVYAGQRLYPFSGPVDLMRFREIPFKDRIRTGLLVLKAARLDAWQDLEQQTAAEWLIRQGGRKAYEVLWHPLLAAKFDTDADKVAAVWIWNKFKLRGHSRDRKMGDPRLGYLQGSFQRIITALQQAIRDRGGSILTGHTVIDIQRQATFLEKPEYRVTCILEQTTTKSLAASAVIAAVSGRSFANMASYLNLPEAYVRKTRAVPSKANICLVLRLKKSLSPYYWTTICEKVPFVVVVEHSHLTGSEPYGGHVVYLSRYLDITDALWTQPDGEIYKLFVAALSQLYPHFESQQVTHWRLCRTRYAQPVIEKRYRDKMPALDTPDPGIKLAGMAQIYPEDRGMNYAIRLGRQAAEATQAYLAAKEP